MKSVILGSLRYQSRRYVAAAIAVIISVVFIVVTNALTSSSRDGMVSGIDEPYQHADLVVSELGGEENQEAAKLIEHARDNGDRASVLGWTFQQVWQGDRMISDDVEVGVIADDPEMQWQTLVDGRFPKGPGEALADTNRAKSADVSVGDTVTIGTGKNTLEAKIVGLADAPAAIVQAALYLPWDDVSTMSGSMYVDSVAYDAVGTSGDLSDDLAAVVPDATVSSVSDYVDEVASRLTNGVNYLAIMLLIFAALAVGVSVLVITNTFAILFAQRGRDFALTRCVGATRRQLVRSVRVEALVVGAVASAVGLVVGAGAGYGLVALIDALFPTAYMGTVSLSPVWLIGAFALGVGVTWAASWFPTRRVARTDPLTALRPSEDTGTAQHPHRVRTALGLGLVAVGTALLAMAVATSTAFVLIAGGGLSFTGLLVLGPIVVPALIRTAGRLLARFQGPASRLAAANAVRHPKRTATTTASLLIGVTLTTAVLTGLASARDSTMSEMEKQHPVDITLTSDSAMRDGILDDVRAIPDVEAADGISGVTATVSDGVGDLPIVAATADLDSLRTAERLAKPGTIRLPYDMVPDDEQVTVRAGGKQVELKAVGSEGWGQAALVTPETLDELGGGATQAIWVRASNGADPEDLAGDLSVVADGAALENGLSQRAYVELQLNVMVAAVVGLLSIAVLIALVGIANTLGLSVVERGREHALLRAVGLTRRQLRRMLATEGLLLSLVAAVLGTAVGLIFAWTGVQTLVEPIIDGGAFIVPWWQLAIVAGAAALAGIAAAIVPARKAARIAPAAGLSVE